MVQTNEDDVATLSQTVQIIIASCDLFVIYKFVLWYMGNKILIVEDDIDIADLLTIHMKDLNAAVDTVSDGIAGLKLAQETDYCLILLDISLPSMNGVEVCKELRKTKATPIIMVTAKSEEIDKVLGLEIGADDYITKPFSVRELKARAKAVMRRSDSLTSAVSSSQEQEMHFTDLSINVEMRKVLIKGKKVELSPKEFDLLVLLASHPGRSYSRSALLDVVWGYNFSGYEHTVNSHMNRLRSKIEPDMSQPIYILTTWGIGYRFNEEI